MPASRHKYAFYSWLTDLAGLACLLALFYALWLGHHPLFTPDEGRYSEVAREMVASGDYITPRLNGVAFLDKPVLYYWLQASAILMFGLKEWALRFWPALIGCVGCIATYATGRLIFSRRTGWLAAILLASSPLYFGASHYANLDLEVAVLISLTLFLLIAGLRQPPGRTRARLFLLAWPVAALAFLTKGLIALFFPAAITSSWLLLSGQLRILREMRLLSGVLIFVLMITPWYLLVERANPGFLHFFFINQQISRFLAKGDFNNQSPFWFYLPVVLAGFLPWSIFICQTVTRVFREKRWQTPEGFLLLWVVIVLLFFSIPKSKTIGYILPLFPPLALLTARWLDSQWETRLSRHSLSLVIYLVIVAGFLPAAAIGTFLHPHYHHQLWPWLTLAAISLATMGLLLMWLCFRGRALSSGFYVLACSAAAFCLIFLGSATTINRDSLKPLALELKQNLKPEDEVVTFYRYYQDLPIYLERRITIVTDWQAADIPLRDNWVRELWYGMPFQKTDDWLISEKTFWERWNSPQRLVVLLDRRRLAEFTQKSAGTIHAMGEYEDVVWASNH